MTTLNKEQLKQTLREIMSEDKAFLKELMADFLEVETQEEQNNAERQAKIDAIIKKDFQRYHNVFKGLA